MNTADYRLESNTASLQQRLNLMNMFSYSLKLFFCSAPPLSTWMPARAANEWGLTSHRGDEYLRKGTASWVICHFRSSKKLIMQRCDQHASAQVMLLASAPQLASTLHVSQYYSLLKEEERLCVAGGRGRTQPTGLFLPSSISHKAHLRFQLSDLLVSLSDIGAVKLSAGMHFMTCSIIIFLPFHRGSCFSVCMPILSVDFFSV